MRKCKIKPYAVLETYTGSYYAPTKFHGFSRLFPTVFCTKLSLILTVDPYLEALGPDLLPSPSYKGVQDYEAITMGLDDKYQVEACRTYLFKYGYTIRPVSVIV